MAGNQPPEGYATDDFLEQILAIPSYSTLPTVNEVGGGSSSDTASLTSAVSQLSSAGGGGALHHQSQLFPLGLSLDNGRDDVSDTGAAFGLKPVSFFFIIIIYLYNFVHFFSLFEPSMEFFALFKRKLESNSEFSPLFLSAG